MDYDLISTSNANTFLLLFSSIQAGFLQLLGDWSIGRIGIDYAVHIDDQYGATASRVNENFVGL